MNVNTSLRPIFFLFFKKLCLIFVLSSTLFFAQNKIESNPQKISIYLKKTSDTVKKKCGEIESIFSNNQKKSDFKNYHKGLIFISFIVILLLLRLLLRFTVISFLLKFHKKKIISPR
jgi:hypothetical protein